MNKILKNDNSKEIKFLTIPEQIALLKEKSYLSKYKKNRPSSLIWYLQSGHLKK